MAVIYNVLGFLAILIIAGLIVAMIKPHLYKRYAGNHATRLKLGVLFFIALVACGGLLSVTEPASVKQARLAKQQEKKSKIQQETSAKLQVQQAEETAKTKAASEAAKKAEEDSKKAATEAAKKAEAEAAAKAATASSQTSQSTINPTQPAVSQTVSPDSNCDPNYTPCIPYVAGNALNCPDIKVMVKVIGTDHNKFDADGNGYGCESYQ